MMDERITAEDWAQEQVFKHTPLFAYFLALAATFPGLRWLRVLQEPIKRLVDVEVKVESNIEKGGKGFRAGTVRTRWQIVRIYKRGKLAAERRFNGGPITHNSPFEKVL